MGTEVSLISQAVIVWDDVEDDVFDEATVVMLPASEAGDATGDVPGEWTLSSELSVPTLVFIWSKLVNQILSGCCDARVMHTLAVMCCSCRAAMVETGLGISCQTLACGPGDRSLLLLLRVCHQLFSALRV